MKMKYFYFLLLLGILPDAKGQLLKHDWSNHLVDNPYLSSSQTALHQTYLERDSSGNIYGLGVYPSDYNDFSFEDFDGSSNSFFLKKSDEDGTLEWIKTMEGTSASSLKVFNLKLDANDNIYVLGEFFGYIDLDPGPDEAIVGINDGSRLLFLAKYDKDGNYLWSYVKDSNLSIFFNDMDLNPVNGSVVIVGNYRSTYSNGLNFNPDGEGGLLPLLGGFVTPYILNITAEGEFNWISGFGPKDGRAYLSSVLCDDLGKIIVRGFTDTPFSVGGESVGQDDSIHQFVLRFDDSVNGEVMYQSYFSDGYFLFNFASANNLIEESRLFRNGDDIWLYGYFLDEISIGGFNLVKTSAAPYSRFLFKFGYGSQNSILMEVPIVGGTFTYPLDRIAGNNDDMLVLTGTFSSTQNFNWTAFGDDRVLSNSGEHSPYILGISTSGEFIFADKIEVDHSAQIYDIVYAKENRFVLSGSFKGEIDVAVNSGTGIYYESEAYDGLELQVSVKSIKAICKDTLIVDLDPNGLFNLDTAMVDDGSFVNYESVLQMSLDQYSFDCESLGGGQFVTLTVEDLYSDNEDSCESFIIPNDGQSPTALCQDYSLSIAEQEMELLPENIDAGSFDNCYLDSLFISQTVFDCSHLGEHTVTLTAIDGSGLSSSCVASVFVSDDIAPEVQCEDRTVYLDSNGEIDEDSILDQLVISDNCELATVSLIMGEDFCDPSASISEATVLVTDYSGNESFCNFSLFVEDNISPSIDCKSISYMLESEEDEIILTEDVLVAGLSDNCSIESLSFSQTVMDVDDLGLNEVLVEATDLFGNRSSCYAQVMIVIRVDAEDLVYIPNVFSPNNDGVNDHLAVFYSKKVMYMDKLTIRDRWGNIHYEEEDKEPVNSGLGWTGQMAGENSPKGVYFYELRVLAINGEYYNFSGTVNLL